MMRFDYQLILDCWNSICFWLIYRCSTYLLWLFTLYMDQKLGTIIILHIPGMVEAKQKLELDNFHPNTKLMRRKLERRRRRRFSLIFVISALVLLSLFISHKCLLKNGEWWMMKYAWNILWLDFTSNAG